MLLRTYFAVLILIVSTTLQADVIPFSIKGLHEQSDVVLIGEISRLKKDGLLNRLKLIEFKKLKGILNPSFEIVFTPAKSKEGIELNEGDVGYYFLKKYNKEYQIIRVVRLSIMTQDLTRQNLTCSSVGTCKVESIKEMNALLVK